MNMSMVDSKQVLIFNSADIRTYTFTVLGGNHVVQAAKELMTENSENSVYNAFNVEVFHDLTVQEARSLANQHNVRNQSLPVTFQKVPRSSCTVLVSVAKCTAYQFKIVEEIIDNFEDINGPGKSVPEKLFKTLMWPQFTSQERSDVLTIARDHGDSKAVGEAVAIKNMKLVKNTFKEAVMAEEWNEVEAAYPQHASDETLKQFCKFPAGQQYVPMDLTEHITSAIMDRDPVCMQTYC